MKSVFPFTPTYHHRNIFIYSNTHAHAYSQIGKAAMKLFRKIMKLPAHQMPIPHWNLTQH